MPQLEDAFDEIAADLYATRMMAFVALDAVELFAAQAGRSSPIANALAQARAGAFFGTAADPRDQARIDRSRELLIDYLSLLESTD